MDFVYACRDGDNEELRYSIRSVLNSFPNANIWVVGGKPDWYVGNYIKVDQNNNAHRNQTNNFIAACNSNEIDDNFIVMNDDFFIINKIDKIEYFYGGLLQDKIDLYLSLVSDNFYVRNLMQTLGRLDRYGIKNPLDYELHIPFPVEKHKLKLILSKDPLYQFRSMYGNRFEVGGRELVDVKVYDSGNLVKKSFDYVNNSSNFLSSMDSSFSLLEPMLKNMFPNPSSCEML